MNYLVFICYTVIPFKCTICGDRFHVYCVIGNNKDAHDDVELCLQCIPETLWETVSMFMETSSPTSNVVYHDFNIDRSRMYVNGFNFIENQRPHYMSVIESFKLTKI